MAYNVSDSAGKGSRHFYERKKVRPAEKAPASTKGEATSRLLAMKRGANGTKLDSKVSNTNTVKVT